MRRMTWMSSCLVLVAACSGPVGEEATTGAEGADEYAAPAPAASGSAEATVVAQLNEMCEENWCAGEFDYEFLRLTCGEASCELFFTAERGGQRFEDSVVFDYDEPLLYDGDLEAGYWERITDALLDEWEPAHGGG